MEECPSIHRQTVWHLKNFQAVSGAALAPGTWKNPFPEQPEAVTSKSEMYRNKIPSQTGSVPLRGEEQL